VSFCVFKVSTCPTLKASIANPTALRAELRKRNCASSSSNFQELYAFSFLHSPSHSFPPSTWRLQCELSIVLSVFSTSRVSTSSSSATVLYCFHSRRSGVLLMLWEYHTNSPCLALSLVTLSVLRVTLQSTKLFDAFESLRETIHAFLHCEQAKTSKSSLPSFTLFIPFTSHSLETAK
jgi:hypothetical protein